MHKTAHLQAPTLKPMLQHAKEQFFFADALPD
jgi:hypothetical protein